MNTLDKKYTDLLQDILDNGVTKQDRTGTGTLSVFGRQIRHKMSEGFPLLTTKKMYFKGVVTELIWFLRGDTNIKYLVDNDCHIWDGDAYKNWCRQFEVDPNNFDAEEVAKGHNDQCWGYPILDHVKPTSKEYKRGQINAYLEGKAEKPFFYLSQEEFVNRIKTDDEFAKKWGDLGPIYGKQWRSWGTGWFEIDKDNRYVVKAIDQIANLLEDLKKNPDSRRLMVSAWNVGEIDQMTLPPCHYGFQVYTRELSQTELNILYNKRRGVGEVDAKYTIGTITAKDPNIPRRAISLMYNARSQDVPLGTPFNLASYGLLLEIIAKEVNMVPDELITNMGDCHIYLNQIDGVKEQIGRELSLDERIDWWFENNKPNRDVCDYVDLLPNNSKHIYFDEAKVLKRTREPYPLPKLMICGDMTRTDSFTVPFDELEYHLIKLIDYQSHPTIKMPLSN